MNSQVKPSVIIIGGGVAGISTAIELLDHNIPTLLLDRDIEENFGGLAATAFGGMCLVGTPEQRKMGIKDSPETLLKDWHSFAEFDESPEDKHHWPKKWAEYYAHNVTQDVYEWVKKQGVKFFPAVNWVERGLYKAGNSVPRYHIMWGTGQYLMNRLINTLNTHPNKDKLSVLFQHNVENIQLTDGEHTITGIDEANGNSFRYQAEHLIAATGGIGGNLQKVRDSWSVNKKAPEELLNGSHQYADGKIHDVLAAQNANVTHLDQMWNYAAGIPHPEPKKPEHGLSLIPCKSALWMDHTGRRIGPEPLVTGFDTHEICKRIADLDVTYTWQILNWKIASKELAISGAEHNQMIRDRKLFTFLKEALLGNHRLVKQITSESNHFVLADNLDELVEKMNQVPDTIAVDPEVLKAEVNAYDDMLKRGKALENDDQVRRINHARQWRADKVRTCKPNPITDKKYGPLMAIKLRIISRKSMGGIQTNLDSQVLDTQQQPIKGLYAVGECAGFGGGGTSGVRSLEGTFISGCILTARKAAKAIAQQ